MTFSQYTKPRYRLVEEEHSLRDSSVSYVSEGSNPKEKEKEREKEKEIEKEKEKEGYSPPAPASLGGLGEISQSGQGVDTSERTGISPALTDGPNISATSSKTAWKSYRVAGYHRIILSLLQRGGCETSVELALQLLRDMAVKEHLTMHQSQVRSLLHCAILNDQQQPLQDLDKNQNPNLELDFLNPERQSAKEKG